MNVAAKPTLVVNPTDFSQAATGAQTPAERVLQFANYMYGKSAGPNVSSFVNSIRSGEVDVIDRPKHAPTGSPSETLVDAMHAFADAVGADTIAKLEARKSA